MYHLSSSCRNCLGFHIFIQTRETDLDYFSNNMGFPGRSDDKESVSNTRDPSSILGWGGSPGEENGNLLSVLPWKIPWNEEPAGLQARQWQRVGHDWVTNTHSDTITPLHESSTHLCKNGSFKAQFLLFFLPVFSF